MRVNGLLNYTRVGRAKTRQVAAVGSGAAQETGQCDPMGYCAWSFLRIVANLTTLHDGCSEWRLAVRWIRGEHRVNREATGTLPKYGDLLWGASKSCNVPLDPFQSEALIVKTKITLC